jgi:metal-responsive CopG/Arc/MetJ family transcriptional regulator
VTITVELHPLVVALLDALAEHLGQSRSEVLAAALRSLLASVTRAG